MMKFFRIDTLGDTNDDSVVFVEDYVKGLEMDDADTKYGTSAAATWPQDASIFLRKTSGRKLTDLIGTITNNLIVSYRLRDCIAKHCKDIAVEYLPFKLYDHRKRLLSEDYVIVNPIGGFDCLDLKASDILWDEDDPSEPLTVNKAVLSKKKCEKAPPLFRIREDPVMYVVIRPLAIDIYDGNFSNLYWDELELK